MLSAVIITHNEAHQLADCLATLSFCDEIVVVDSGSADGTAEIARAAGAHVSVTEDWPGFGPQKQRALDLARGDWVLSIDADERIDEDLAEEILAALATGEKAGYRINRLTHFLGKPLRHGGWYPDFVLRLARRDAARFSDHSVHERLIVEGATGDLRTPIVHLSYPDIDEVLSKMRRYALATAAQRRSAGRRGGAFVAAVRAFFTFLKCYVLQLGFLDGAHGFVAAGFRAEETFWRYLAVGWERGE